MSQKRGKRQRTIPVLTVDFGNSLAAFKDASGLL